MFDMSFWNTIKGKTLKYIESMRAETIPYGQYRYASTIKEPVLYASIYAALTRHLYRDLANVSNEQKNQWIKYIQSYQAEDGLFQDPLVENDIVAKEDWWGWRHLTCHAIIALTALGAVAQKKFKFLEPFYDKGYMARWLESRNWDERADFVGNEVLNLGTLLQYERDFHGDKRAGQSIKLMLDLLSEYQDPKSGLWGFKGKFDTPELLSRGVQGAYHFYLLYFYDRRPIQYVERIIDNILLTQNEKGGFGVSLQSNACEDIDSIDPLVRLSFITQYRADDIRSAIIKALPWVLSNQNEDGGFVFKRGAFFKYGHDLMSSEPDQSAMFPTWWRTLSLAYIYKYIVDRTELGFNLDKEFFVFTKCPGYQFWSE